MAASAGPRAAATARSHTQSSKATHCAPSLTDSRTARSRSLRGTTTLPTPIRSGPARICRYLVVAVVVEVTSVHQQGTSSWRVVGRSLLLNLAHRGTQGHSTLMKGLVTGTDAWSSSKYV